MRVMGSTNVSSFLLAALVDPGVSLRSTIRRALVNRRVARSLGAVARLPVGVQDASRDLDAPNEYFSRSQAMAPVPKFYSINEARKPAANRVCHNNYTCASGRDIPERERRSGTGGYRLCGRCEELEVLHSVD